MSELRISMVGIDTSHCDGIVRHFNDPEDAHHIPGFRITKAFPGGNPEFSMSRNRIDGFVENLKESHGIPMVDSLDAAAEDVDALIVTSVDGRQHLEQIKTLVKAGKPIFVDKPFACSSSDARAMVDLCRENSVALMSCSSLRYAANAMEKKAEPSDILMCETFGPMAILEDFPPYYWYGIHSAEMLYVHMGRGCRSVRSLHEDRVDIMAGRWEDGRVGVVKGMRQEGHKPFGRTLYLKESIDHVEAEFSDASAVMLEHAAQMFKTGEEPIDNDETVEIAAFLEAAEKSYAAGGSEVQLAV